MKPELIVDTMDDTGEGPLWHPIEKKLYWGDITEGELYRYDPTTGGHELVFDAGEMFGGYTFQADGSILMFLEEGRVGVLRDGSLDIVIDGLPGEEENRFNDVIADPEGRVYCGTMCKDSAKAMAEEAFGSLYLLDTDGTISKVLDDIAISNGLGFTPDLSGIYYTDSPTGAIWLFDYDRATGAISNRRDFVASDDVDKDGLPDGMTVDAEGNVWSARVLTGEMHRYSPSGELVEAIDFPCDMVSSAVFGGEGLDELYVTTISSNDRETHGPGAGALFRLRPGVKGVPEFFSNVSF
ncbi:MAG: SMP-30/gluconolactonase/LRE family protein [Chloroflexi bacterium]|nr:SMP-30/gluconolactonase/LRE family protein [Chloroflexota bacterium]